MVFNRVIDLVHRKEVRRVPLLEEQPVAVAAEPARDDGEPAVRSCMVVPTGYAGGEGVPN